MTSTELHEISNAIPDQNETIELPVIPTGHVVVYPETVRPVTATTRMAEAAITLALNNGMTAIVIPMKNPKLPPTQDNLYQCGTEVALRVIPQLDDMDSVIIQGRRRVRIVDLMEDDTHITARAKIMDVTAEITPQIQAMMRASITLFRRVISMTPDIPAEILTHSREIEEPGLLADIIASTLDITFDERMTVLQTIDPTDRLRYVTTLLSKELTMLEMEEEIESQVQLELERGQRETYLREQMRVIQSELGESDVFQQEINELQQRVEDAKLPPEAHARAMKEISRLAMMPPLTPEIGLIHTYIDWLVTMPWHAKTTDNLDIAHAEKVLDEDHYGLSRVKDRVLEYIAVRKLAEEKMQTPILCFVGPPGTGKTSLGKSIARALGREFVRVSLGGVRDEAEIRGHRRTYVGALPGRIIQTMRRAGTINPVFMLDEIDKLGVDFHGDPASALLEVLDPEQNNDFFDHYLDVPYDLSQVLFITTANDLYPLPPALEDRLEIIEFPGYIEEEKLAIARQYLIPRQLEAHGIQDSGVEIPASTLQTIIREYTYEAGVRNLNRRIAEIMRKVARQVAEGKRHVKKINTSMLDKMLGAPDYNAMRANDEDQIGVVTGLAWTSNGGDIMTIEVSLVPGKGTLTLTGQLGEVMQESAQTALSYMRSRADDFMVPHDDFENYDLHIHLPEGAVPKDGPSAGVTLAVAIISTFTERQVRSNFAMTGEITLHGKILPVGGIREKVMAARRNQINNIILPEQNKRDLIELPKRAISNMNFIFVNNMQQVIDLVLLEPPINGRARDENNQDQDSEEYEE